MRSKIIMLFLGYFILFTSCSNKNRNITKPEEIGKQASEILKKLSNNTKQEYIDNFFSIEELRELANNDKITTDEEARVKFNSTSKEEWTSFIEDDYNSIKAKGAQLGIIQEEIKYLDFVYKTEMDSGVEVCKGDLYFLHSNKSFKIHIISVNDTKKYKLVKIENLKEN